MVTSPSFASHWYNGYHWYNTWGHCRNWRKPKKTTTRMEKVNEYNKFLFVLFIWLGLVGLVPFQLRA